MKLLALLSVLVLQCAATKSWNSHSEETFSLFGWLSYLKRLSLIVLTVSGVILYYVPESRPHARKICHALIDFTANSLKFVLSTNENEYEGIKSQYHRSRYEQSLQLHKRLQRGIPNDDVSDDQRNLENKMATSMIFINDNALIRNFDKKRMSRKNSIQENRHHRHSLSRVRSSAIKDLSEKHCTDIAKPIYFPSDKLKDIQKFLKSSLCDVKRSNRAIENYAVLISGSPRQMAMLDQKYNKDDIVFLQDPYLKMEQKECNTYTEKLSSKTEISSSDLEGPTRDNGQATDSGMDTYGCKEGESMTIRRGNSTTRLFDDTPSYQMSEFQCGGGCCSGNGCSISSTDFNNNEDNLLVPSKSLVNAKTHTEVLDSNQNSYGVGYSKSNDANQKHEEDRQYESTSRTFRRRKPRNSFVNYSNNISYLTDQGGEADDENSQHGGWRSIKHDLDETPEREGHAYCKDSYDTLFEDYDTRPIFRNPFRPTLFRAINWIFGGCPGASKNTEGDDVGKEETRGSTDEWLH